MVLSDRGWPVFTAPGAKIFARLRRGLLPVISTIVSKNSPLFSAKIIYENTIFAKKNRAYGAKIKDLAKILENKGDSYIMGNS